MLLRFNHAMCAAEVDGKDRVYPPLGALSFRDFY